MGQQSILITGCSAGGIGDCLAQEAASRGHRVFATLRTPSKISEKLRELSNVTVLSLDVTDASSIELAFKLVSDTTGGSGLDILINNAGSGYTMPLADVSIDQMKKTYDTNVFGLLAVTNALLPLLVQAKGTIVNVTSIGGMMSVPWIGVYSSSKAAVISLSETLRVELAPLGVSVMTLVPGTVASAFHSNLPKITLPSGSLYKPAESLIAKTATGELDPAQGPGMEFAKTVMDDILAKRSGKVYRGNMSKLMSYLLGYLPTSVVEMMVSRGRGLEEVAKAQIT